jgi:hypothetical protein
MKHPGRRTRRDSAPPAKKPLQGEGRGFREPLSGTREAEARGSHAARQLAHGCGSAIGRAILEKVCAEHENRRFRSVPGPGNPRDDRPGTHPTATIPGPLATHGSENG